MRLYRKARKSTGGRDLLRVIAWRVFCHRSRACYLLDNRFAKGATQLNLLGKNRWQTITYRQVACHRRQRL